MRKLVIKAYIHHLLLLQPKRIYETRFYIEHCILHRDLVVSLKLHSTLKLHSRKEDLVLLNCSTMKEIRNLVRMDFVYPHKTDLGLMRKLIVSPLHWSIISLVDKKAFHCTLYILLLLHPQRQIN